MSDQHSNQRAPDPVQETADHIIGNILGGTRSREDISPSGQLYRFVERFHQSRRTENRTEQQLPSLRDMAEPDPERRRRPHREATESSPLFVLPPQPQTERMERPPMSRERVAARLSELATSRRRPRMMPSDRYLERQRALSDGNAATSRSHIQDAEMRDRVVRQMEEASNSSMQNSALENAHLELQELRARVDNSMTNTFSSIEYPGESNYPRVKRRKLDSDKVGSGFSGFSYGKYGQVEPGKLKMEIVSCDGGIFEAQHGAHREDYEPENVLLDDTSVYCTKSNRCNLVLRHQGNTTFCLTEMVIKAPRQNYTAPIQEGLVFVSMTLDDLLTRTAKYQIQYSPARPRRPASERDPEDLPLIMSVRHNGDGSMSTAQARARRLYDIGLQDEDCDSRTAQMPSDFTSTAPGFTNTTECSDSEDETTPLNRSRGLRSVHRLMSLRGLRFEDSDDSGDETPRNSSAPWHEEYLGIGHTPTLRRRETASNITLSEAADSSQTATQEPVVVVGGELMVPHARFFIERDKSKTTIKFDPPVSGRFILLKLWSPHPSPTENIDIQTVVAKGFAGPRFFPAVSLR